MESLWEIYLKTDKERDIWCYYKNANINHFKECFEKHTSTIDDDGSNAIGFIAAYFNAGNKLRLLELNDKLVNSISKNRAQHILSVFVLGIYIHSKFPTEFQFCDIDLDEEKSKVYHPWLFAWFLACLYHDIGYTIEDKYKGDNFVQKKLKSFLPDGITEKDCEILNYYQLGVKYYNYRRKEKDKNSKRLDHGVIGGIRLFSVLENLYNKILNDEKEKICNNLYYGDDARKLYRVAADAIIRHNMWNACPDTVQKYIDNELEELIPTANDDKRVKKTEPITFLLGLCDTIEPIKRFEYQCAKSTLETIGLEIKDSSIIISFSNKKETGQYKKTIKELENWLEVEVKDCEIEDQTICTIKI